MHPGIPHASLVGYARRVAAVSESAAPLLGDPHAEEAIEAALAAIAEPWFVLHRYRAAGHGNPCAELLGA